MKKIFLGLMIVLLSTTMTVGCGKESKKGADEAPANITVLDSKIDYFVYRDKKIYLTKNFEEYVSQFKGLGCKINSNIEIDNIDFEKDDFTSTIGREARISCPILTSSLTPQFTVIMNDDKKISSWSTLWVENMDIYIDGTKITIGEDSEKEDISDMDKLTKVLGKDYEVEEDDGLIEAMIYDIDGVEYTFYLDNGYSSTTQSEEIDSNIYIYSGR